MATRYDPDEGIWGRVLLASLGIGLIGWGLLLSVRMTMGGVAGPSSDGFYGLAVAAMGLIALVAAAIGTAVGRWTLVGVGLLLLAQAVQIGLNLYAYQALGWFTTPALAASVILGVASISVSLRQIAARRRRDGLCRAPSRMPSASSRTTRSA